MKTDLQNIIAHHSLILTECAIAERLRHHEGVQLHPTLFNTPLIYDTEGAAVMRDIYLQYRSVAQKACLPLLLCAPTWRLDQPRLKEAGFNDNLLTDAVTFMRQLQTEQHDENSPLILGGLIAPKKFWGAVAERTTATCNTLSIMHQALIQQRNNSPPHSHAIPLSPPNERSSV